VRARGSLANADRRLKGEMFVTAEIEVPAQPGVTVPAKAVFLIGTTQYVFVEEAPGRYARVKVEASGERDGTVAIARGVNPGQRVVVEGSLFLQHIYQKQGGK
jgi:cobalt-zinc-cadmium efflux system membrane fusion protein